MNSSTFHPAIGMLPRRDCQPMSWELQMRIVDIRHKTVPISSTLTNAYIDFSKMDVSVVALVTDVVRDGRTIVGYGFNSNGRYAPRGLLQDRFIPRLIE